MIFGIYAIKDAKSSYMPCTVDTNDSTAIRNFEHAVSQPGSLLASHSNDFALFKLGTYDDVGGYITPLDAPKMLCDASQCLPKEVK
jgi:hypothetical protein